MNQLSFSIFVSNTDSLLLYSGNNSHSFCVELPYVIHLPGKWSCHIPSVFSYTKPVRHPPSCIHILLDFIRPSIAYGTEIRIGGTFAYEPVDSIQVPCSLTSSNEEWFYVEKKSLERISVDIVSSSNQHCTFLNGNTVVVIQFRREDG